MLILRTTRTAQPRQWAGVDPSNPLARGLIAAYAAGLPSDVFGRRLQNVNATFGGSRDGVTLVTNGSSTRAYIDFPRRTITQFTLFALTTPTSVSANATVISLGQVGSSSPTIPLRAGNGTASRLQKWSRGDNSGTITGTQDTTLNAFVAGQRVAVGISATANGGLIQAYINGAQDATTTTSTANQWTVDRFAIGTLWANSDNNLGPYASSVMLAYERALSEAEHAELARNPWQLFAPEPRRIWVPVAGGGGGVSGTSATTNAADTSSASGSPIIVGTSATTNAADTSTAIGTPIIVGTSATTNAADTSSASGTVGGGVVGTSATTNANDTSAASGSPIVNGTSTTTNAADTASAAGWAGVVSGTVAVTNANDTASAEGFIGAEAPRRNTGAGKSKRRRYTVEVDGEEFDVSSPAEAEAVLSQVREQAEKTAAVALERAKAAEKRPTRKVLADARKALTLPEIKVPDEMQARVQATLDGIESLYQSTLQTIEIAALLRKRQQEEEDDEDILLLIA